MGECGFQREFVAPAAEPDNHACGDIGKIRAMAKRFAGVDVGQMDFDEGNRDGSQSITQGHAGMGITAGIEDDEADVLRAGRLHAIDQLTLVIALEAFQPDTAGTGTAFHGGMNVGQRGAAVNFRLAGTEKIQVRTVQDENGRFRDVMCLLLHSHKFAANESSLSSLLHYLPGGQGAQPGFQFGLGKKPQLDRIEYSVTVDDDRKG